MTDLSHWASDTLEAVTRARRPADLWRLALRALPEIGISRIVYRYTGAQPQPYSKNIQMHGVPAAWMDAYLGELLFQADPVYQVAQSLSVPFFWFDMDKLAELSGPQMAYMARLRAGPMGDGLTVPLFGPRSNNALMHLGFGSQRGRFSEGDILIVQSVLTAAHLTYCRFLEGGFDTLPALTLREREVLEWISAGKSNSVIADILGISAHTVDTILRRIFAKLDVTDRTTAAIKGIGLGLVDPGAQVSRRKDRVTSAAASRTASSKPAH